MILPDDVDEKVEFWVGETDSESDHSDGETIVGGSYKPRMTRLSDTRSTKSENGISSRKRRKLGNGLMAVQPLPSRNSHTFALRLETRGIAADAPKRIPREKRWSVVRGLPDTGSEPALSRTALDVPYTHGKSTSSLSGHERSPSWSNRRRPPGLGLDLWPDYVSPRPSTTTTKKSVSTTVQDVEHKTTRVESSTLSPQLEEAEEACLSPVTERSIDEEEPKRRRKDNQDRAPTSMFGTVWNWAWHWR